MAVLPSDRETIRPFREAMMGNYAMVRLPALGQWPLVQVERAKAHGWLVTQPWIMVLELWTWTKSDAIGDYIEAYTGPRYTPT